MKKLYRPISVFLAAAMLFAVLTSAPFHVSAAGYSLRIVECEGGSVVRENFQQDDWSTTTYEAGTRIMLSASPDEDYEFVMWDVHFQNDDPINVERGAGRYYYFDIPEDSEDKGTILIGAIFAQGQGNKFTATINANNGGTNNTVKFNDGSGQCSFSSGELVYIHINWEPGTRFRRSGEDNPNQYKLHARSLNGEGEEVDLLLTPAVDDDDHADEYYFSMPASDVTVSCEFEYANHEIIYEKVPDPGVDAAQSGKPYFMIDGQRYDEPPVTAAAERKVDVYCPVNPDAGTVCYTGIDMEYADSEGNAIAVTLPVDTKVDKSRTLHAKFDMPDSNVKLKLKLSRVYKVNVAPSVQGLIEADPVYAMAGDTVTLSIAEDDHYTIDQVQVKDSHDANVELNADTQFTMPADNVTVSARLREKYIERSWDGEKVVETVKTVPEDAIDISTLDINALETGKTYVVKRNTKLSAIVLGISQANLPVNLVLCDGAALLCDGIDIPAGATLNIFDQKDGTGKLGAEMSEDHPAIGGLYSGNINIHGGNIQAQAKDGAVIGGRCGVTIYSGNITAKSTGNSAGIGGTDGGSNGLINIYGGNINAMSEGAGAGIGSGSDANQGSAIFIYGGTVNAQGGKPDPGILDSCGGAGIGGGQSGASGYISISGGTVKARANGYEGILSNTGGAGIGAGDEANHIGEINITGGTVEAYSMFGAGIGGGYDGNGGTVKITEGIASVTASSYKGSAIGRGYDGDNVGTLEIFDTAMVTAGDNSNTAEKVISSARVSHCLNTKWAKIEHCDHQGNSQYISRGFEGHSVDCMYCGATLNDVVPHRYQQNAECADCHYRSTVTIKKVWMDDQDDHPDEVTIHYDSVWQPEGEDPQIDYDMVVTLNEENEWKATIPAAYGCHKLILTEDAEGYVPDIWTFSSPNLLNVSLELPEDDIEGKGSARLDMVYPPSDDYRRIMAAGNPTITLTNQKGKEFTFKKMWPDDADFDLSQTPDEISLRYFTAEGGAGALTLEEDEEWTTKKQIAFSDTVILTEDDMENYAAAGWIIEGGGEKAVIPMQHGDMNTVTIPPANYDELDVPQETRDRIAAALAANDTTITVVNTEKKTYSAEKKWEIDFADKDRPDEISLVLQRRESWKEWKTVELINLSPANNWSGEFEAVPKAVLDEDPGEGHIIELENYKYRIRELGPKENESDPDPDPGLDDFQEKVNARLVYAMMDLDKDYFKNLISRAANPDTYWKWEPDPDWVTTLTINVVIPTPYVIFKIEQYNDGVKDVNEHETKYIVDYSHDSKTHKSTITNTAALDTSIYKRWLNFDDGEVPESVYLMLESKVQQDYADRLGEDAVNIYTPVLSGLIGSFKITDIPPAGEAYNALKDKVSSSLESYAIDNPVAQTAVDTLLKKYLSTGLCLAKADGKHKNPFIRWSTNFTVKKYGMGDLKLPMDFAGVELVTGLMELVLDAIITAYSGSSKIHTPVMYQPIDSYWSIKGYSLNIFRDYELTSNVINFKFHGSENEQGEVVGGTKYWKGDTEEERPESVKIHVYYKDDSGAEKEVAGSPVTVTKGDSNGSNGWVWGLEIPKDSPDAGKEYYIREDVPPGYEAEYSKEGWDVTNTKSDTPPTEPTTEPIEPTTEPTEPTTEPTEPTTEPTEPTTEPTEPTTAEPTTEEPTTEEPSTEEPTPEPPTEPPTEPVTGSYKFTHIDRYGTPRTKTVEVELKDEEITGYSGNNNQGGVPTYLWTEEARELYNQNPLVAAALAVNGNDDDQQDVSVYKSDVEWDLIKTSAADATNMTPDPENKTLTVLAKTTPYTFTFKYYFVKDGKTEYKGARTGIEYGKPVTFHPKYSTDPDKYVYINDTIPPDKFCYWSADEAGLIPITTNLTFGMLMRGKWLDESDTDRVVSVYAQYENHLTEDWNPLIEEATFTHMIEDNYDWVYLDYMTNYLSKDGKVVQDMLAQGEQNIRYGLVAVKYPGDSAVPDKDKMIAVTQALIQNNVMSAYLDAGKTTAAYRFEYGQPDDTVKPISNFNRVLYTLRSDTQLAENKRFSVIAYITVDGQNYFYSEVNSDIDVHELLKQ